MYAKFKKNEPRYWAKISTSVHLNGRFQYTNFRKAILSTQLIRFVVEIFKKRQLDHNEELIQRVFPSNSLRKIFKFSCNFG